MLTVHHLGVSQSERIVWLCEELEIPYELKRYERDSGMGLAPAAYKTLHPVGTAPIITDDETALAESGAIIEYIIARHGGGRLAVGPDAPNFADYLFWFHFANGSMMPRMVVDYFLSTALPKDSDHPAAIMFRTRVSEAFSLIEDRLGKALYFAGDAFTAADIIMLFPLTTIRALLPRDLTPYPHLLAYLQRIGARPAFQRAMRKADPDLPPQLT